MAIQQLINETEKLKQELINHPLYQRLKHPEDIKVFMEHHVFAVWDFMSLLKSLQKNLTCVDIPWVPKGNANTRFLINEIVVGEESDVDEQGNRISHFELYLQAMKQASASCSEIEQLLARVQNRMPIQEAMLMAKIPDSVKQFVLHTFNVIATNKPHVMAAVFTFGREDLIPGMFMHLVKELNDEHHGKFGIFQYYLERHIEVDGDHHSKLAVEMTNQLCNNDPVKITEAESWVISSLMARKKLWDGVLNALPLRISGN